MGSCANTLAVFQWATSTPSFMASIAKAPLATRDCLHAPESKGQTASVPFRTRIPCRGQRAVGLLLCIAALHDAVWSGLPAIHCRSAGCNGQWAFVSALPHFMGQWAVGLL